MKPYSVAIMAHLPLDHEWDLECTTIQADNENDAKEKANEMALEILEGYEDHIVYVHEVPTDMIIDAYNDLFPYED